MFNLLVLVFLLILKSNDMVLQYYFDESESHPYE